MTFSCNEGDDEDMDSYLRTEDGGAEQFRIGEFTEIPGPVYIPELKGAECLHAVLDHVEALEPQNPLLVPAAKWSWLRTKKEIRTRVSQTGDDIGSAEIESLESNHPILFYDPPELYNYRRTKALTNYVFKNPQWNGDKFENHLARGEHDKALRELPAIHHPFIHANPNRVLEEIPGADKVDESRTEVSSTDEAWIQLEQKHLSGYYHRLVNDAQPIRSAAMIAPVPQLSREWNSKLVSAWLQSNQVMSDIASSGGVGCYFHLYLDYRALDPEAGRDTTAKCLRIIDKEVSSEDYSGIALTVHHPHKIWQTNRSARLDTSAQRLSTIGSEKGLPIICPRSEWFGSYITDFDIQGFSSLLNGQWQYSRYSSEGGPTGGDTYGKTMIPHKARAIPLVSENGPNLDSYLEENGGLPEVPGLPSVPPNYNPDGRSLKEKYGTNYDFRRTFGKPRRLAHVFEAKLFREQRMDGISRPAREYLRESENQYVLI